jgi:hypothetical protein
VLADAQLSAYLGRRPSCFHLLQGVNDLCFAVLPNRHRSSPFAVRNHIPFRADSGEQVSFKWKQGGALDTLDEVQIDNRGDRLIITARNMIDSPQL